MKPLFRCRACGFLSTLGSEFTRRDGVMFDRDCLERADAGEQPIAEWVADALARPDRYEDARHFPTPRLVAIERAVPSPHPQPEDA